jgi:hypothetical protein
MSKKSKLLLIGVMLFAAALACSAPLSSSDSTEDNGGDSSSVVEPDASGILFQDDFSSSSSGWSDLYRDDTGMTDYDQSGFRIQVLESNFDYWANPNLYFTDTVIEVDATKLGGPEDNDFGVICRYSDAENFYFFIVTSDGYYGIGKYMDGEQQLIDTDQLGQTDKVLPGNATNKVKADCVGSTLRLYANGSLIHEVSDSDLSGGDVGLIAGTFDEPGTDILFDNFVVTAP